jgi:4-amino-4-deoxy-L-arabinose transferase-like glycosyltransferase
VQRPLSAAALLVIAAVALAGLGSAAGGTHPDEGLYLALGVEMHARDAWLTPTVDGAPDFTKPPLLYWAMRGSFALFGVHLWSARLPVALAALALAWVAGRLARSVAGAGAEPLAILFTGTALGLLRYGRLAMMDVPLALALAAGLWMAWRVARERFHPSWLLGAGVAASAAALLKGPVGPVLLALVGGYWLLRWRREVIATPWVPGSVLLGVALAAPWYLAMAHVHGGAFLGQFFGVENVGKFRFAWTLEGEAMLLLALPVLFLPWTPLVQPRSAGAPLAWPWILCVLLVFSLPGLKHAHYIVPALAPLSVLAAGGRLGRGRWVSALVLASLAVLGVLAVRFPLPGAVRFALSTASLLVLVSGVLVARAQLLPAAMALAGATVLLFGAVLPSAVPPPVPEEAWKVVGSRQVFTVTQNPGLLTLLLGRPVHRAHGPEEIRAALASGGVLVLSGEEGAALPSDVRQRLVPLASWSRLRGRFPFRAVLDAWREADLRPVSEMAMFAVARP